MTETQVAIIGGETLLGREVKEIVEGRGTSIKVKPVIVSGSQEKAEERDGEAVVLETLDEKSILTNSVLLLAGSAADALHVYDLAKKAGQGVTLLDGAGHLEALPEASLVAPLLNEPEIGPGKWLIVVAHPAASALALVLTRLARYRTLKTVVANVLEPASQRGKPGVSELHQQTTALLNFKPLTKDVFDSQVSFNLLPRVGEDSPLQLASSEARIDRDVATLLSRDIAPGTIPMPSIRVAQAPVFHGYSISAWVEFAGDIQAQEVEEALASAQIEVRRQTEEPPDNVGAASQSGLIAGDIRIDRNNPRAVWIWIVMDNLRIVADAMADVLRVLPQPVAGRAKPAAGPLKPSTLPGSRKPKK